MEAIMETVGQQTQELTRCMQMRAWGHTVFEDDHVMGLLAGIDAAVTDMEGNMAQFKSYVENERAQLQRATLLLGSMTALQDRTDSVRDNLPEKLPGARVKEPLAENLGHKANQQATVKPKAHKKKTAAPIHKLAYVRVDEFESVPQYIRGRLKRDRVNDLIDNIHTSVVAKYKILNTPRSKLGQQNMEKWLHFKEQETKDTKGVRFFVEDDIRTYTSYPMNSAGRASLTVLRHLGRLREIRGAGIVRHCLTN